MFVRYGLLALALSQASTGLWALFAPHSFYDDFPPGRGGWVSDLGTYNQHMTIDYGSLSLAIVAVLVAAAVVLERRLVLAAAGGYLFWSVPHFVYHMTRLDELDTGDAIGNTITLAFTVALPVAIVLKVRSGIEERPPARRSTAALQGDSPR